MKKVQLFALLLVCTMAMVACTEPTLPDDDPTTENPDNTDDPDKPEVKAPVLRLDRTAVELNSAGGPVSVGYQIENPVEGVGLQVEGYADWLSVDSATAGTLTLSATKNTASEPRATTLTLSYEGAESVSLAVSQKRADGLTFQLNFSDIAYSSFIVQVLPSDGSKSFYIATMERSTFEQLGSDDAIFESEMARVRQMADNAWLSFSEMLASLTYKGEKWQAFNQLRPETDYVTIAVGITSSGTRTSDISYNYVTTTAEPTIDMDFTIGVSEYRHKMSITITPARKKEAYVWDVFPKAEIERIMGENGLTRAEDTYKYIMAERVRKAAEEGTPIESLYASIIKKGTQRNQPFECEPATDYYIMASALNNSCVPGAVTLVEYTSEPMATPGSSDNEIQVEISNPADTYVQVSGSASNMDPYVVLVLPTELCESKDDAALFEYILATFTTEELDSNTYEGGFAGIYNGLTPSTAYTAVAFGYADGVMTTTYIARSESITTLAN